MKTDKIFTHHPNLDEYFKTSDGKAFYKISDAKMHARKLEDKKIDKVQRNQTLETDGTEESAQKEREALVARYTELFEKAPAHNAGNDTIAARIAEKEEELQKLEDETKD